jgi:hypothetical protein
MFIERNIFAGCIIDFMIYAAALAGFRPSGPPRRAAPRRAAWVAGRFPRGASIGLVLGLMTKSCGLSAALLVHA